MTSRERAQVGFVLAGMAIAGILVFRNLRSSAADDLDIAAAETSVPLAEKRLVRLRQVAAELPAKENLLKQAESELAMREKGLIQAETANQAQAQVVQILRKLARAQSPPVDIKGVELGQPKPFGDAYGEVAVSVSMDCRIEQVVQLLADLTAQPELLSTGEIRVGAANGREKIIPVRLTVSGIVPKKLIPEKKGTAF